MTRHVSRQRWESFRVIIRDIDFEIHATINSSPETQEVVYELQHAILTVFRVHAAKAAARRAKSQDHQQFKRRPLDGMPDFLS